MSYDMNELIGNLLQEDPLEKQASESEPVKAPSVADELRSSLLVKSASEARTEAEDLGRKLAQRLMEKAAGQSTGGAPDHMSALEDTVAQKMIKEAEQVAPQENLVNAENAAGAAEAASVDAAAKQSGNTVEGQTAESLQKGLSTNSATATSEDLARKVEDEAEDNMQKAAAVMALVEQGHDFYGAANLVAQADAELQKEAAFNQLIGEGYSFDDATSLIKAASEGELSEEIEKKAALDELLGAGYAFDDAVDIVKEAGLAAKIGLGKVMAIAQSNPKLAAKVFKDDLAEGVRNIVDKHGRKIAIGAGAVGAAGAVGGGVAAYNHMQKKAAFDELMAQGYSFDDVVAALAG